MKERKTPNVDGASSDATPQHIENTLLGMGKGKDFQFHRDESKLSLPPNGDNSRNSVMSQNR